MITKKYTQFWTGKKNNQRSGIGELVYWKRKRKFNLIVVGFQTSIPLHLYTLC
jgi:hypothetical protein